MEKQFKHEHKNIWDHEEIITAIQHLIDIEKPSTWYNNISLVGNLQGSGEHSRVQQGKQLVKLWSG